jgi:hypothetical protein
MPAPQASAEVELAGVEWERRFNARVAKVEGALREWLHGIVPAVDGGHG